MKISIAIFMYLLNKVTNTHCKKYLYLYTAWITLYCAQNIYNK